MVLSDEVDAELIGWLHDAYPRPPPGSRRPRRFCSAPATLLPSRLHPPTFQALVTRLTTLPFP